MMGPFTEAYQPLGDLQVTFAHGDIGQKYRRRARSDDWRLDGDIPGRRDDVQA